MARKSSNSTSFSGLGASVESSALAETTDRNTGGLTIPQFDANSVMPSDLFTDGSSAPRTPDGQAEAAIISIKEKINTVKIAHENIKLARATVGAATEHVRLVGDTIVYATAQERNRGLLVDLEIERTHTEGKQINYQIAQVDNQILGNKLLERQERLIQSNNALAGVRAETPLLQAEIGAKIERLNQKVAALNGTASAAKAKLEGGIGSL